MHKSVKQEDPLTRGSSFSFVKNPNVPSYKRTPTYPQIPEDLDPIMAKKDLYSICSWCTHTENIHRAEDNVCCAYGCNCEEFR